MSVVNFRDEGDDNNENVDKDNDKTLFIGNHFMGVVSVNMRAMKMVILTMIIPESP